MSGSAHRVVSSIRYEAWPTYTSVTPSQVDVNLASKVASLEQQLESVNSTLLKIQGDQASARFQSTGQSNKLEQVALTVLSLQRQLTQREAARDNPTSQHQEDRMVQQIYARVWNELHKQLANEVDSMKRNLWQSWQDTQASHRQTLEARLQIADKVENKDLATLRDELSEAMAEVRRLGDGMQSNQVWLKDLIEKVEEHDSKLSSATLRGEQTAAMAEVRSLKDAMQSNQVWLKGLSEKVEEHDSKLSSVVHQAAFQESIRSALRELSAKVDNKLESFNSVLQQHAEKMERFESVLQRLEADEPSRPSSRDMTALSRKVEQLTSKYDSLESVLQRLEADEPSRPSSHAMTALSRKVEQLTSKCDSLESAASLAESAKCAQSAPRLLCKKVEQLDTKVGNFDMVLQRALAQLANKVDRHEDTAKFEDRRMQQQQQQQQQQRQPPALQLEDQMSASSSSTSPSAGKHWPLESDDEKRKRWSVSPNSCGTISVPFGGGGYSSDVVGVLPFYYPGKYEPCDQASGCGFLGNFFDVGRDGFMFGPPMEEALKFHNAEAAFQALKFWGTHAKEFAACDGQAAFELKKTLESRPGVKEDRGYAGFGTNWNAMKAVLKAKFECCEEAKSALRATGNSFLLEHNSAIGRDWIWSNDGNGEGQNWLGMQLMLLRDELSGVYTWTHFLQDHVYLRTGEARSSQWQDCVKAATREVKKTLGTRPKASPLDGALDSRFAFQDRQEPVCKTPGCTKITFNRQPGFYCSRTCRDIDEARLAQEQRRAQGLPARARSSTHGRHGDPETPDYAQQDWGYSTKGAAARSFTRSAGLRF